MASHDPIADSPRNDEPVLAELVEVSPGVLARCTRTPPRDDRHGPRLLAPLAERQANEPFGVPSRFGIGTLLVVTASYGALLALLRALDWDRQVIGWIVVFISVVGASQMLLFGSRRPRQASLITGAIGLPVIVVLTSILHTNRHGQPNAIGCGLCSAVIFGAPAGYLAGGVVAGVFLIMDAVQRGLTKVFPAKGTDNDMG